MTDTPVVALLLLLMSSNEANIPVSKFAPFGPENGDSLLPFGDDNCVGPISLKQNFTFFGRNRTELWLGTNGMIGFNSCAPIVDRNCQGSNASVEVFSADIYTISVGGLIYYKEETNIAALEAITNDMKSAFPEIGNVKLNWSFRATYINVTFYGVSSCLKYTNATFPRNSFQVILAGDGVNSFVIFHYDTISWVDIGVDLVCSNIGGYQARVGLFSEVGSYVMPGSCSSALKQISNNSNVEFPGKYVFKVDRNIVQQPTVKFCPMINPPQNGYANFTSTSIGSNIRFSCSSLYTLVGSESIKCQSDGSWSSIPPTCKK